MLVIRHLGDYAQITPVAIFRKGKIFICRMFRKKEFKITNPREKGKFFKYFVYVNVTFIQK